VIYCKKCGSPNRAGEVVCEVCGEALSRTGPTGAAQPPQPQPPSQPLPAPALSPAGTTRQSPDELSSTDRLGIFAGNLCLSPLLGIVLYFVWRDKQPVRAAQTCTLTKWAVGIWVVFVLLAMVAGLLSEM
jgi:hypothetical protein